MFHPGKELRHKACRPCAKLRELEASGAAVYWIGGASQLAAGLKKNKTTIGWVPFLFVPGHPQVQGSSPKLAANGDATTEMVH
jgi:hypothetical protein